jgi:cysteine synthase A
MDSNDYESRILGLADLVGNTPLLSIDFEYMGKKRTIYTKAENMNLTGSIKDRMALYIIIKGYQRGELKPGDTIVEATSGNTGIAFSAIGRALGHPVLIFMPDWLSSERKQLIPSLGAEIRLISNEEGGFEGCIEMAEEYAKKNKDTFLPRQFSNEDNVDAHYTSTGPEIWWQMSSRAHWPDAFVAGVGTGGTLMGVGKFLRKMNPHIKLHPLQPANSPTLSTGYKTGSHRIEGICDEFIPDILNLDILDEIVSVEDGDAILMSQKLGRELGLGVGISSGANFLGGVIAQNMLSSGSMVVTVFADDNKKYLSTDLVKKEPIKEGYLSPDIELKGYRTFNRNCRTCPNSEEHAELLQSKNHEKVWLSQ